ncbi:hypothetical protein GWK08_11900 [Leptobacterium flavescens]|uniref:DUF3311 domain-containing protein n=1 Tax=Leptobacterium flavescens TaxID=472055 RepID=A0A6P0UQ90_9FLAO|nr:hypothetical protein [Leptobacterium flavescens]NER14148.1 hypothetical protein [Leptobacterium flavescens]
MKKTFPSWVWITYLLLFSLSIPWYIPEKPAMMLILGLPLWVIASILSVVITAIFTVWIINKYWKEK